MASCFQFREKQLPVDSYLKPASHSSDQNETLYLWFKIFQQIRCQAHGPVSIVSNCAVFYPNFHGKRAPY